MNELINYLNSLPATSPEQVQDVRLICQNGMGCKPSTMNSVNNIPANVETMTFTATHYGKHGNVVTNVVMSIDQDENDGLFDLNVCTIKAGKSEIDTYTFPTRKAAIAELKMRAIRYTFIQSVTDVTFTTKD